MYNRLGCCFFYIHLLRKGYSSEGLDGLCVKYCSFYDLFRLNCWTIKIA